MSWMPVFMPWPPAGLCTWAASPPKNTRPARSVFMCLLLIRKRELQFNPYSRAGMCTVRSYRFWMSSSDGSASSPVTPSGSVAMKRKRPSPIGKTARKPLVARKIESWSSGMSPARYTSPST